MVSYDISKVWSFLPTLVQALPATLALMVLTTLLGSAFGLVLTWAQVSEDKVGAGLAKGYVFTLRCTPPIVLLFLVFYGLPQFLNWWLGIDIDHWSKFVFVLVAMFLLFAAMISEVFKAAYLAIPKGQMEAGLSIGLTPVQTIWRIVLHQAFRVALPNMTTAILNLMRCRFGLYHWLYRYYGSRQQLDQPKSWELFPRDLYSCSSDLLGNCPCDLLLRSTP